MSDAREQRGMEIAKVARIDAKGDGTWLVPSMSGNGRYVVNPVAATCTCPDFESRGCKCKHLWAVEFAAKRETTQNADGTTTVTETVEIKATKRVTYSQDWPAYNEAQTNEKDQFQILLRDLCEGIQNAPREPGKRGRNSLALSDVVFSATFKIYSTFSGRRFISDLREAHARGYTSKLVHYNSIFKYLESPELTPILHSLIIESSKPLASIESVFAPDSSGFSTSRFVRWFDQKYGVVRVDHDWVKIHIMTGVKTNIVTAVEIHGKTASDSPILPALLDTTAKNFTMKEVPADKGYSSIDNHNAIASHGAVPYIPFKSIHTGKGGGLWEKMFHYFNFKREEFLGHYHKRSNVESTFSMVKAKTGDSVRSKTDVAMRNEALCKILCHNICCLISAFYELGIGATFWGGTTNTVGIPA
jgi:transposase